MKERTVSNRADVWWNRASKSLARWLVACAVAGVCSISTCFAADLRANAINKGVVELETGSSAGISVGIAEDLARLVDDGATRRVLPVVGRNEMQNIWDLVLLRGIDMAIIQIDVLDSARQQRSFPGIETSLTYVTKLYNEELHVLAGPDVKTIADLSHKRVNVGTRGSGTSVTAARLFDVLKVPVEPVYDGPEVALERLRHGDIAAMAFVAAKPAALFQGIQREARLHFVPVPLGEGVIDAYLPTTLSAEDYPALIARDQPVDTVAVGSLLAVAKLQPGSERYRNVSNFVDVFFTEFRSLLEPGNQPKWQEINLAAEVPGWTRFPPAQQWLNRNTAVARQNPQDVKGLFSRFLDARQQALGGQALTEQQKQELFNQFQRWQAGQAH
jgi:uncharacterized protein